jgi:hypothetical protein
VGALPRFGGPVGPVIPPFRVLRSGVTLFRLGI